MQDFDQEYFESNAILFADESRGIYIPKHFAQSLADDVRVLYQYECDEWPEVREILLSGPDHQDYWEAWEITINHAKLHHKGKVYYLYQDGDLWLVPESN